MFKIKSSIAILFVLLLFVSCSKNDAAEIAQSDTSLTTLSAINAIPGSKGLDLYVDDIRLNKSTENFDFGAFMNYRSVYPGQRALHLVQPGATVNNAYATKSLNFAETKYHTVFITGTNSSEILLAVDEIKTPDAGKISIRFVNLSPDAPELNFQYGENTVSDFSNLKYQAVSSFVELTSGMTSCRINSRSTNFKELAFDYNFADRGVYTVFVKGLLNTSDNSKALSYSVVKY
ncbi:DUF4397 domain-containing protein [Sphingobacterium hungaricum]|uniref:DUF4397 domain-containing protein n=1 Tax=Sphingobacterium hungaricum TaxID=2082723 RepID=A0A928YRN9_9SPHI|nr:DUF4397 domain-containing protein [Sphingobacterium hungaricum]MBE8715511.1 hypothetical protein [Sphingobacterium hungaricum]